jgi:hypothetical protein
MLGMPSLPVEMYRDKLARGLYLDESQKHGHRNGLDKGIVKQVVRAFANPRYVFDSSSVPGALVSVYDVRDREGKPVMASLVSAAKANRIEVNLVTSIYGKTEKRLQEWVDEGLLRYVDDTKKPEGILRLQLPSARPSASFPNILRKSRIVNEASPASQSSDPLMIREPENDGPNIFFERATRMDISPDEDGERRVYALAEESRGDFERTVRGIAGEYSAPDESIRFRGNLKKAGRAREKVDGDYGGDWGRLLDVNGATIVFGDYGKAKEAYGGILRNHADIIARQKIKSTDFGYRDFTLNIRMPNGFIGELQLLDKAVFDTKNSGGHMIYEAARSLEKYNNHKDKYEELFGKDICASIGRLYEDLKSWSVEVYSSSGFEYDKPGSSANLSATLRESNELSSLLRENMPLSRSVGSLSMTDLPSADGASTASKENPPSSVLMGISQISKYLTAIEDSYTDNIPSGDGKVNR